MTAEERKEWLHTLLSNGSISLAALISSVEGFLDDQGARGSVIFDGVLNIHPSPNPVLYLFNRRPASKGAVIDRGLGGTVGFLLQLDLFSFHEPRYRMVDLW